MSFGKRAPRNFSSPGPIKRSNAGDTDTVLPHRAGNNNNEDEVAPQRVNASQLSKKYQALQSKFMENGLTQQCYYFLTAIAQDSDLPLGVNRRELMGSLVSIAKQLLMNGLEIAVWSLYLEKFVWSQTTSETLEAKLIYSAFASKTYMNHDISAFQQFILTNKIEDFNQVYNTWLGEHRERMSIPPKLLNARFIQLNSSMTVCDREQQADYNCQVDEILTTTTQYNTQSTPMIKSNEDYRDFLKVLTNYKEDPNRLVVDPHESEYVCQELSEEEEVAPAMSQQDKYLLNSMLLRADSIFGPTVLEEGNNSQTELLRSSSTSSNAGRIRVSKPALEKMGSLLLELESSAKASEDGKDPTSMQRVRSSDSGQSLFRGSSVLDF